MQNHYFPSHLVAIVDCRLLDKCPGTLTNFGEISRCVETTHIYSFTASWKRQDMLIFLQPEENEQMSLFWDYTPNPARQVDTCMLSHNNVCDYDSGKCLPGTDCTDCGGANCKPNKCFVRIPEGYWPQTCDDEEWKTHPLGPWDCKAIERELRLDCAGCACEYTGAIGGILLIHLDFAPHLQLIKKLTQIFLVFVNFFFIYMMVISLPLMKTHAPSLPGNMQIHALTN